MPVGQSIIQARRAFHAKAVRVLGSIVYSIFHGFIHFSGPDLRAGAKDALKKTFCVKKYLHKKQLPIKKTFRIKSTFGINKSKFH